MNENKNLEFVEIQVHGTKDKCKGFKVSVDTTTGAKMDESEDKNDV